MKYVDMRTNSFALKRRSLRRYFPCKPQNTIPKLPFPTSVKKTRRLRNPCQNRMSTWCCKKQQRQRRKARISIHLLMTHSIQFNPCPSQFHQISCNSMKRDNLITWLKILWVLMGFLLFPLLYTFLPVFHKPYFIIGYVVMMMAAIYMIFIRERAEPVEPLAVLPPRSSLMAVINYSPGEGEEEEKRECVICLSEFEKDEELAKMGCCGSMFHAECVGKWAQSHSRTCPICHESYIISV